jgi:hypothetical protein
VKVLCEKTKLHVWKVPVWGVCVHVHACVFLGNCVSGRPRALAGHPTILSAAVESLPPLGVEAVVGLEAPEFYHHHLVQLQEEGIQA